MSHPAADITIERVTVASAELCAALGLLTPQLTRHAPASEPEWVATVVGSPAVHLLVARDGGAIVGLVCLVLVPQPTGIRARLEDLVVDELARGRGVAVALVSECIERARAAGARDIDLTSNPTRTAAIAIYEAAGFVRRSTNAYRLSFMDTSAPTHR